MAERKLYYLRGTCLGCRKCLFCAADLQKTICKCNLNLIPGKTNRTEAVKQVYTRCFEPNWAQAKFEFIQDKITKYNYKLNLKKVLDFHFVENVIVVLLN